MQKTRLIKINITQLQTGKFTPSTESFPPANGIASFGYAVVLLFASMLFDRQPPLRLR